MKNSKCLAGVSAFLFTVGCNLETEVGKLNDGAAGADGSAGTVNDGSAGVHVSAGAGNTVASGGSDAGSMTAEAGRDAAQPVGPVCPSVGIAGASGAAQATQSAQGGAAGMASVGSTSALDDYRYLLCREGAKRIAGGDSIPRRSTSYPIEVARAPRIEFRTWTNEQAEKWLQETPSTLLGASVSSVEDAGSILRVDFERGVAYVEKQTGAWTINVLDIAEGAPSVANEADAVDIALDGIEAAGLLQLGSEESLDVCGVSTTFFADNATASLAEYRIQFGRRYAGVPIIAVSEALLSVRVSVTGQLSSVRKSWYDIAGEMGEPIELVSSDEVASLRNPAYAGLEVESACCGYGTAPLDETGFLHGPGVGCRYVFEAGFEMSPPSPELVNLSTDGSPPFVCEG